MLPGYLCTCPPTNRLRHPERRVRPSYTFSTIFLTVLYYSLCLAVIIALPIATPAEFKNTAKFALGDFTNCRYLHDRPSRSQC